MPLETEFTRRFRLIHPVIQAPMAGGGDTPELVAAVSNAGAMGFIGAAYLTPEQIVETGRAVRSKTSRPFGINLFAPLSKPPMPADAAAARDAVAPYYAEFGTDPPGINSSASYSFADQLDAALETGAAVFSFTFGLIPAEFLQKIKARGLFVMGTATRVAEAIALERSGVDAVIAQGSEAGGHRGTFHETGSNPESEPDFEAGMVGTMALVPQIADAVPLPVIASGGIMDGRGLAAALMLGASAVQMGTAFLTCHEAGASKPYREALLKADEDSTGMTRAFSGRPARGIVNRFMREMEHGPQPKPILPFPYQNGLTRPLRTASAKSGSPEFLSLWAGQGVRMTRQFRAADLVASISKEAEAAIERLRPN